MKDGAYSYDAQRTLPTHSQRRSSTAVGGAPGLLVKDAPVCLVLVSDLSASETFPDQTKLMVLWTQAFVSQNMQTPVLCGIAVLSTVPRIYGSKRIEEDTQALPTARC